MRCVVSISWFVIQSAGAVRPGICDDGENAEGTETKIPGWLTPAYPADRPLPGRPDSRRASRTSSTRCAALYGRYFILKAKLESNL
jgi:hypothetical protein